ncbi:MAG: transposase, partial [Solirubrobacteraceae bacterium]
LTSLITLTELGDVSRMRASRQAVRAAGIDIGVHRSDRTSRVGTLTRHGSADLRWARFEAAQAACRPTSPDRQDDEALTARGLSHTRASLTIARKLTRRSYHVLRELGPAALEPLDAEPDRHCRAPSAHPSLMSVTPFRPAPTSPAAPTINVAVHERQSDRSRSTGTTKQPSRYRPNSQGRGPQIRQGVHGDQPQPARQRRLTAAHRSDKQG